MSEAVADLDRAVASTSPAQSVPERNAGTPRTVESDTTKLDGAASAATPQDGKAPDLAKLENQLTHANKGHQQQVRFEIDSEHGGNVVVKILDTKTDKVVRTIPPEELVEFSKKLQDFVGVLFDHQA